MLLMRDLFTHLLSIRNIPAEGKLVFGNRESCLTSECLNNMGTEVNVRNHPDAMQQKRNTAG